MKTLEQLREDIFADMELGTKPISIYDALKPRVDKALRAAEQRGIMRAAEVIEQHSEYYQSNATDSKMKLSPRISASLTGLAYARAIRALAKEGE